MSSDAIMEYVTPRNVTNGSTAGNGVLCGSASLVPSWNNRNCGKRCFLLGPSRGHITRISRTTREVESLESLASAVSSWETDPSEVVADSRVGGGAAPIISRCVATPCRVVR
jgi:hypothetical protein